MLNMNIDTLLSNSGVDVTSIKKMIADKNYKELYSSYPEAIELMCFVTSEYEFNDFISEMGEIDEEAFLLALAATRSLCCWFGVNEEDEMEQYKKSLNGEYTVIFNDRYQEGTYYIFPN